VDLDPSWEEVGSNSSSVNCFVFLDRTYVDRQTYAILYLFIYD